MIPEAVTSAAPADVAGALSEVEEQLGSLMVRVRENIKRAATKVHPDLSPFGYRALWQLEKCGPLGASALASILDVDKSFISRQIRQLEEWGLIEVTTDSSDGRARVVALSERSARALQDAAASGKIALHSSLQAWSAEDLRQFAGYLRQLNAPL